MAHVGCFLPAVCKAYVAILGSEVSEQRTLRNMHVGWWKVSPNGRAPTDVKEPFAEQLLGRGDPSEGPTVKVVEGDESRSRSEVLGERVEQRDLACLAPKRPREPANDAVNLSEAKIRCEFGKFFHRSGDYFGPRKIRS